MKFGKHIRQGKLLSCFHVIFIFLIIFSLPTTLYSNNLFPAVTIHDSLMANINSNPQKSLQLGFEILNLSREDVPDTIRAFTTLQIGYILDKQGFLTQALAFYLDAADMLSKIGLHPRCGYLYIDIGNLYYRQGEYEKATEKYQKAGELFRDEGNWAGTYTTINNFGLVEKAMGNPDTALAYFRESLNIARDKLDVPYLLAHSYKYIGDFYHSIGQKDSALFYFDKTMDVKITKESHEVIGLIREKSALILLEQGDTLEAIRQLKQAENSFLKINHLFYLINIYQQMADQYFSINTLDSALVILDHVYGLALGDGLIDDQIQIQKKFIRIYESTGETHRILEHQKQLNQLLEERYKSEISTQIHRMDIQNLLLDYQHRLTTKELELRNSHLIRNSAIMAGLFLVIMLWFLYNRYRNHQFVHRKILEQKEKIHTRELQIEAMKKEQANRELVCKAALIEQQNSFLDNLKNELIKQAERNRDNPSQIIRKAVRSINYFLQNDTSWEQFEKQFINIYPGFFDRLKTVHPSLTINELKICAYHRMNLDTKEIASLTALTIRAIQTSRYRLKKKLSIPETMNFYKFIQQL